MKTILLLSLLLHLVSVCTCAEIEKKYEKGILAFWMGKKPESYSQDEQDVIALRKFLPDHLTDGVFVEIGAHDGVSMSNTLLMEKKGWTGMLIEANYEVYQKLVINRPNTINIFGAAYKYDGNIQFRKITGYSQMLSGIVETVETRHLDRMEAEMAAFGGSAEIVTVPCFEITNLLLQHNLVHINYMSIDIEGAEMELLKSIDFSKIAIDVIQIENNYLGIGGFDDILLPLGYRKGATIQRSQSDGSINRDVLYTKLPNKMWLLMDRMHDFIGTFITGLHDVNTYILKAWSVQCMSV